MNSSNLHIHAKSAHLLRRTYFLYLMFSRFVLVRILFLLILVAGVGNFRPAQLMIVRVVNVRIMYFS